MSSSLINTRHRPTRLLVDPTLNQHQQQHYYAVVQQHERNYKNKNIKNLQCNAESVENLSLAQNSVSSNLSGGPFFTSRGRNQSLTKTQRTEWLQLHASARSSRSESGNGCSTQTSTSSSVRLRHQQKVTNSNWTLIRQTEHKRETSSINHNSNNNNSAASATSHNIIVIPVDTTTVCNSESIDKKVEPISLEIGRDQPQNTNSDSESQRQPLTSAEFDSLNLSRIGYSLSSLTGCPTSLYERVNMRHSYRKPVFGLFDHQLIQNDPTRSDSLNSSECVNGKYCCCCRPPSESVNPNNINSESVIQNSESQRTSIQSNQSSSLCCSEQRNSDSLLIRQDSPVEQTVISVIDDESPINNRSNDIDVIHTPTSPDADDSIDCEVDAENESQVDSGRFSGQETSLDGDSGSAHYRSCPDLMEPQPPVSPSTTLQSNIINRPPSACHSVMDCRDHQTPRSKPGAAGAGRRPVWQRRAIRDWSLDELLLWLQHLQLDDVASLVVGYDLSGRDVDQWTSDSLLELGIEDGACRAYMLDELDRLRHKQKQERLNRRKKPPTSISLRQPLFNLVRSSSFDQIVAFELPLSTRDLSVASTGTCGLQVTKVNKAAGLKQGDCILEINSASASNMAAVDFTKILSEASLADKPVRLVVLRRHSETNNGGSGLSSDTKEQVPTESVDKENSPDTDFKVMHF